MRLPAQIQAGTKCVVPPDKRWLHPTKVACWHAAFVVPLSDCNTRLVSRGLRHYFKTRKLLLAMPNRQRAGCGMLVIQAPKHTQLCQCTGLQDCFAAPMRCRPAAMLCCAVLRCVDTYPSTLAASRHLPSAFAAAIHWYRSVSSSCLCLQLNLRGLNFPCVVVGTHGSSIQCFVGSPGRQCLCNCFSCRTCTACASPVCWMMNVA
jgi:hypothetical protein